jgi:hypothetical protein
MFRSEAQTLEEGRVRKITLLRAGKRLSYAEVIRAWRQQQDFRDFYLATLAEAPFQALFWESPPITTGTAEQPYECVLIDSFQLTAVEPDPRPFASSFALAASHERVLAFENLGKDALLIVPCPSDARSRYGHLAAFVRSAPDEQLHALFQKLGAELDKRLSGRPIWVSTSGLGLPWLHIRLDSYPKYYNFRPYTRAPTRHDSTTR